jgi:hypothetical protein
MPLTPAIRPVNIINNAAESPISPPPIAAEIGVKSVITSSLQCYAGNPCSAVDQRRSCSRYTG